MVIVSTPSGTQQGDVILTYRLVQVDGSGSDISLQYSIDSGSIWLPATAKGGNGTSGVKGIRYPGLRKTIIWDTIADGVQIETCRVRITASRSGAGKQGPPDETEDFTVQNPQWPVISWVSKPDGIVREVSHAFTWQLNTILSPVVRYFYGLDENPPTNEITSTSVIIPAPSLGSHTFRVYAQTSLLQNSNILETTFTADNAAANILPTVTIDSGPSGTTYDNTPTFTYTGTDSDGTIAGYFVSIDINPPDIWTTGNSWTSTELSNTAHTFFVIARDNEGKNSSVASQTFTVIPPSPNELPSVTILSGPSGTTYDNTPTFTYEGLDNDGVIVGYFVSIDTDPPDFWTIDNSWTSPELPLGPHTFYVTAQDNDGANSNRASRPFTVEEVPNQPPTVSILSGPSGTTYDNTPTFTYEGFDSDGTIAGYFVSIDINPPDIWTTQNSWTSSELSCGSHTFYVMAQDNDETNSNILTLSFMIDPTPAPNTIHVSEEFGNDNNDGSSWSNAVASISKGIELGSDGQTVLVADGIYTGPENRKIRLFGKELTVKSANGPAACIIDCQLQEKGFYLVDGEIYTSVIDGFTIINGDSAVDLCGGGIYISSNPIIRNCIIKDCIREWGGGMGIDGSGPEIVNCIFENNSAYNRGAGIYIKSGNANIIDCTFRQNNCLTGGGIYTLTDNSNIIGCTIVNNHAVDGGGLKVRESHTKFINCIIASNTASFEGGGLLTFNSSEPVFTNCVFENNSSVEYGGGIRCASDSDKVILNNCIIWNNHTGVNMGDGISHQVTTIELNSCVFDNGANFFGGSGTRIINSCITLDPQFENVAIGNYRLQSTSPCIDAGDNALVPMAITTDPDGNQRIVDGVAPWDGPKVDIGAYEYQP